MVIRNKSDSVHRLLVNCLELNLICATRASQQIRKQGDSDSVVQATSMNQGYNFRAGGEGWG